MTISQVFISHISEEGPLAAVLKRVLEAAVPRSVVWVSGQDIPAGRQWLEELNEAIDRADAVVVLCSARSCSAPWVNFEAGGGWGKEIQVVPVCHTDMTVAGLPFPLSALQGFQLSTPHDLVRLVKALDGEIGSAGLDDAWSEVEAALRAIDYVPRAVRPLPPPIAERGVLVDLSHGQAAWPQRRRHTVFSWASEGVGDLPDDLDVEVRSIDAADQIRAADLAAWHGAIVAMPFHARLTVDTIDQTVEWVEAGGRLALLGYELGDLHHGGNLGDLAECFALRFNGDIVAPTMWTGPAKPYGADVTLESVSDQPLFDDVISLTWRNVQTIAREPGTYPLLTIADNSVAVPTPDSVGFAAGYLTMPAPEFTFERSNPNVPVVAEATRHLTGKGRVIAVGTWDLLPEGAPTRDNARFVHNLLRWLTGA